MNACSNRSEFFSLQLNSVFVILLVTWKGLCVWVTLPRLTQLSVEPGCKAGRRFDSSPFRQLQNGSNSFIRIETTSPEVSGRQCL
jgi:hypothetical protein